MSMLEVRIFWIKSSVNVDYVLLLFLSFLVVQIFTWQSQNLLDQFHQIFRIAGRIVGLH